jgi:hypothetical protein
MMDLLRHALHAFDNQFTVGEMKPSEAIAQQQ